MFETFDRILNVLTRPEILSGISIVLLVLSLKFAHVWTKPPIALAIGGILTLLLVYACLPIGLVEGHAEFVRSLTKPDNVPIVMILGLLFFFFWLSLRKATLNDARIAKGEPPIEAAEKTRKVLVWPDLVYTGRIAMVASTPPVSTTT